MFGRLSGRTGRTPGAPGLFAGGACGPAGGFVFGRLSGRTGRTPGAPGLFAGVGNSLGGVVFGVLSGTGLLIGIGPSGLFAGRGGVIGRGGPFGSTCGGGSFGFGLAEDLLTTGCAIAKSSSASRRSSACCCAYAVPIAISLLSLSSVDCKSACCCAYAVPIAISLSSLICVKSVGEIRPSASALASALHCAIIA